MPDGRLWIFLIQRRFSRRLLLHAFTERVSNAYLVNVGSVGLPGVNAGSPDLPSNQHVHWAEYGVLGIESGRLSIELRRTPLDMSAVLKAVPASGMPHVEWWILKWESN